MQNHTFRILGMVTAGGLKFSSTSFFGCFEMMRGLMLRKMVMMRILIGNMRRPLSTPTMISCQVICREPGERVLVNTLWNIWQLKQQKFLSDVGGEINRAKRIHQGTRGTTFDDN